MSCPNCGSDDTWHDNMHWGCNECNWCSLAGLNKTKTSSTNSVKEKEYRDRTYEEGKLKDRKFRR